MKTSLIYFYITIMSIGIAVGQDLDKNLYRANTYYSIKNYNEALPLFLDVISKGIKSPEVYYRTGYSYYNSELIDEQVKGIEYYEFAIASKDEKIPAHARGELAELYLKDEQIAKAIAILMEYKEIAGDEKLQGEIQKQLKTARTAHAMVSMAREFQVRNMGNIINSAYTEYNPVVSADESLMAFTALRPNTSRNRSSEKFSEQIHIAYNTSGNWQQPDKLAVNSQYNIGTAGLSPDGQRMLIYMGGAGNSGNLFYIDRSGQTWSSPTILSEKINSRYIETSGSITPDGKTIYFASNRKEGFGGFDIYRSVKMENGEWGAPQNLGPKINTAANEDAPFIHPDQQTLFFTSDGENTMGGRDIFVSRIIRDTWTSPENIGYPVNSTANDNYFTLTADGSKGYFSSDRKGGFGAQDIYSVEMPKDYTTIPLTMIKGKILDGETQKALPTKIYVIDNESGKKLDFVYQPDAETGSYLVILPPSKNYDMIIESEGFLPYTLNINIPGQNYFYELYQKILLNTIRQFDVVVGQEVQVQNAFYDTHNSAVADQRKQHEAELVRSDSINVYELMNDLIASGDQAGIEYLVELIQLANPIESVNLENSENLELANRTYYYDESDEGKFEKKVVDGKTIFSLPTFHITEEAKKEKSAGAKQQEEFNNSLLEKKEQVYFAAGKSELRKDYHTKLDKILHILKQHPQLGVEILGYASSEGDKDLNRKLSNDRAIAVLNYINQKGIVRRRIIARGYGEHKNEQASAEESRSVELRIVDLRTLGRGEAENLN